MNLQLVEATPAKSPIVVVITKPHVELQVGKPPPKPLVEAKPILLYHAQLSI